LEGDWGRERQVKEGQFEEVIFKLRSARSVCVSWVRSGRVWRKPGEGRKMVNALKGEESWPKRAV
jgi:hypothetical protein